MWALSTAIVVGSLSVSAVADIVGTDDRIELRQASQRIRDLGRSIAVVTSRHKMIARPDGKSFMLLNTTAEAEHGLCADQPFAAQGVIGECTATLVAPDVVLLAAHCLTEEASTGPFDLRNRCESSAYIFDFREQDDGKTSYSAAKDDVFYCKSVARFFTGPAAGKTVLKDDGQRLDDYAFVTLDRKVPGVTALRLPKDVAEEVKLLEAKEGDRVVLHHPHGVVQKVSPVGAIERTKSNLLRIDVDVSHGSSGAPLIDVGTGTVLAILKGITYPDGYKESTRDEKLRCRREYRFPADERPVIGLTARLGEQLWKKEITPKPRQ